MKGKQTKYLIWKNEWLGPVQENVKFLWHFLTSYMYTDIKKRHELDTIYVHYLDKHQNKLQ